MDVELDWRDDGVMVSVVDDGGGGAVAASDTAEGVGLIGMIHGKSPATRRRPASRKNGCGDKTSGVRTKKGPAQGAGPALTGRPATRLPAGYRSSTMPEPYQTTVTPSRIKFLSR